MCDDLLAHHHLISAPSSIPLSSNPTWFTTQQSKPTDAPPRTYLFLPLSFSIDPVTCLSTARRPDRKNTAADPASAPSAATATTTFDYFPAFFEINKRWTIYAFDKSVLALYPQKADRCEMIYEMVYSHAQYAHQHHLHHPQLQPHAHSLHSHSSPQRGRLGYPPSSSTPHSRSNSPGPHHHQQHHNHNHAHVPHIPNLTSSYDLVEDTTWFTSTQPHLRTLLSPSGSGNGEKCLSLIDLHSPPPTATHPQKRAGYILLLLPTPTSPNRIYISRIEIFPEYRGAGGGRQWSLVGRGLVKMLLEAVVEVAGDFSGAGEGVDIWMNLGAETETEPLRMALGMGWVVNRSLWVVEQNEVEEQAEEEKGGSGGGGSLVVVQEKEKKKAEEVKVPQQKQEQQVIAGAATGEKPVQQQQQQQGVKQEPPAVHAPASSPAPAHAASGTGAPQASPAPPPGKPGKHWSFGDWGRGMKGWRERWVKTLDDISHGHGHGNGKA